MGTDDAASLLRVLLDRQLIWECLLRYARGMDRLDEELAMSAYHAGATEDHGALIAPCEQFVPQVLAHHRAGELATQHILSNHSCEIDGDIAHAETYCRCFSVLPSGRHRVAYGRFVDVLERRDGRWGIVSRISLPEGAIEVAAFDDRAGMIDDPGTQAHKARDRSDASYRTQLASTGQLAGKIAG